MCSVRLAKPERLRRGSEIRAVFRAGRKVRGRHVDVYVRDRSVTDPPRVAVVAGRRVGIAVQRNRAKRRIRAAIRECGMPLGRDAVLVAKAGADTAPYELLRVDVERVRARHAGIRRARRG